ncbi:MULTISPECIES: NADH-quinone oxidoreductase subunit B family protein [Metallosphaera]|uniref:NADH-quinone oxidoreductase subunit B family protein n=1 Tax=Metallosphaera TaxID=41980 RepID=UPI001F05F36F|nr:NADH:ubiquinone oxidoreductase [Metallosphaera sedula]MCH1770190.1 NADH:ubiquinone oxidoreductase [Metallosphaera sedula]MCP6727976.1 NADH:ubiquinone oxidoreductase [Metallosphaera sedula]BBL47541.1 membrane-bound hydrogenase subunit mbhJ [Metallosphaera sedula]
MNWFIKGIRMGVKTEDDYHHETKWPSRLTRVKGGEITCPTDAIGEEWKQERCIFCRACEPVFLPTGETLTPRVERTDVTFKRSFYLYPLDAGSCGGCNLELRLISSPQYDMTRFGIFFTNTPKHADALLIMGNLGKRMEEVIRRAYDVMPSPKLVILLGTCAISGGVTGIPPDIRGDVIVPGCPPTPASILDALIKTKGGERE